jgi:prepilin-type N-terminal cleavage/methylation domain-containing protein
MFSLFTRWGSSFKDRPRFYASKIAAAFTLVELMVTIAIATIIMSVVLISNSQFNSSIILTNAAYEVALAVRQAQAYGLSSKVVNVGASGAINQAFGVYVSILSPDTSKYARLFADANNDKLFSSNEEVTGGVALGRGLYIKDICYKIGGVEHCYSENPVTYDTYISTTILFIRPDPEARVRVAIGAGNAGTGNELGSVDSVKIVLGSQTDATAKRCVIVSKAGQISVKSAGTAGCL